MINENTITSTQRKVRRSEQILNRIANKTGMTTEGKYWLIKAVDPFHDVPVEVEGMPDGMVGNSVVQTFNQSITLDRGSIPAGDNWDALIFIDDSLMHYTQADSRYIRGSNLHGSGHIDLQGYVPSGGLIARSVPNGANPAFVPSVGAPPGHLEQLCIPNTTFTDKMRVISQAFEVRNETAEVYKQGNVVVFEQPVNNNDEYVILNDCSGTNTGFRGTLAAKVRSLPPQSVAAATMLPGTKNWEAKYGCYVVGAMEDISNHPRLPQPNGWITFRPEDITDVPPWTGWLGGGGTCWATSLIDPGVGSQGVYFAPTSFFTPFNRRGAYFTGLSSETVLKINYRVTVERFPGPHSPLVTLGRPSPMRDAAALELYTEIMGRMPVGVPVSENGLGDWFTGAVASIVDTVTGTPFAGQIDKWQKEYSGSQREKELEKQVHELTEMINVLKSALNSKGLHVASTNQNKQKQIKNKNVQQSSRKQVKKKNNVHFV